MPKITDETANQVRKPATTAESADLVVASTTSSSSEIPFPHRRGPWRIGPFHFRFLLSNLRPGRNFAERRFSIAEAMTLFLVAYLTSHGLGLVRQIIFNALFGAGPDANAYYAAFRLPDTLFNLIAGGALVQAFIPVFVTYEKERGQRELWYLTSLIINVLLVALTALILAGEFVAPAFVNHWLVPGFSPSEQALTTNLTRVMLVQPLLLGISSITSAILYSKRQFLLPALSIAVYNIGTIGGLLVALAIPRVGIYGPTVGVVASAGLQTLVQLPGLLKQGIKYTLACDIRFSGLHEVLYLLGPNIIAVCVAAAGSIVNTAFSSYLPDKASLAAIHNANLLFDLPVAFLGQKLGLVALPQLSRLAASSRYTHLSRLTMKIVGGAVLISIPAAIMLFFMGKPIIHLFLEHGAFTRHVSNLTTLALLGYAFGLPGRIATELLSRSFYAIKNAITPLIIDTLSFAIHIGLVLLLIRLLTGKYVILAIPLATAGAVTIDACMLFLLLFFHFFRKLQSPHETLSARYHDTKEPASSGGL